MFITLLQSSPLNITVIIKIVEDVFLTMVSTRGSMMAGMRPSNRIPMRASKDGPV